MRCKIDRNQAEFCDIFAFSCGFQVEGCLAAVALAKAGAEGVGFEPTVGCPTLDFESSALNRTQPPFHKIDTVSCDAEKRAR
jgi:hypothetical protein